MSAWQWVRCTLDVLVIAVVLYDALQRRRRPPP
jgi:hypothetical protein